MFLLSLVERQAAHPPWLVGDVRFVERGRTGRPLVLVQMLVPQGRLGGCVGGVDGEIHKERCILAFLTPHELLGETRERIVEVGVRLVRDKLPVLVQLVGSYGPVPFVPPCRNVVTSDVAVAVEVLAEQGRLVTCVVEPGGERGSLSSQLVEGLVTTHRGSVAPDQVVVRVLPGQDRGPGWAAERVGDEGVIEGQALVGNVPFERRYLRDRRDVQVVRKYEDDIGTVRRSQGTSLYLSGRQEEPETQAR